MFNFYAFCKKVAFETQPLVETLINAKNNVVQKHHIRLLFLSFTAGRKKLLILT